MTPAEQELAHLRAEVERLRREGSVAVEKVAELIGEKDSTKARMQEHLSAANALALRIMRERNDARSKVERLREVIRHLLRIDGHTHYDVSVQHEWRTACDLARAELEDKR